MMKHIFESSDSDPSCSA